MYKMDESSDLDHSAFLFSTNLSKRRAGCSVANKSKKLRLNSEDGNGFIEKIEAEKETRTGSCLNDSIHAHSPTAYKKILKSESETSSSNEKSAGENDTLGEKLLSQRVEDNFSCPLCLKILQSRTARFSHMKQCAKKSKMSAKQLLEALKLHKKHLKERLSLGLSNIPLKKKKVQVQEGNGDALYQLALGLALSKSLEDTVAGNGNGGSTDNYNINTGNKTTLENFGFTSFGKPCLASGKKSKNSRLINSVLKKRTCEEREKLLTEKASMILLINDNAMITKAKESLRLYQCKHLEVARNKDSYLWKLGESNEETAWYVENLKPIIVEEIVKVEEEEQTQNVVHEENKIDGELLKLNLPKATIFEDWRRLINNEHLSDLTLQTKDNGTIFLHSVVLYARYPKIFDSDFKRIFQRFDTSIVLKFLQYLYCGTLDGLVRGEVEILWNLTQCLQYQELLKVLCSLRQSLSESNTKESDENGSDFNLFGAIHSPEWQRNTSSTPEIENRCQWEWRNFNSSEERISWSVLSNREDQSLFNGDECNPSIRTKEFATDEEGSYKIELLEDSPKKRENIEFLSLSETTQKEKEICEKWKSQLGTCSNQEDQSEMDMFEEAENLNKSMNENIETSCNVIPKDDPECIEISSGSMKSDATHAVDRENPEEREKILSDLDYDIPYFDPYEHFNSDIPETEPFPGSGEQICSQSLIIGEISPVKSITPNRIAESILDNASPCIMAPESCSTPNNDIPLPSTSSHSHIVTNESSTGQLKKRRYATPSSILNRKYGRLSKFFGSKSQKKYRARKNSAALDEEDSEKVTSVLTESILKEFDNSIGSTARKTPPNEEQNYVEVTPTIPDEEYVEDISPLPDYSVMGASSIKKHLTKYGLKKSLSKNKAKKILRHIYEELHPILNMKNGKIVKYVQREKQKKSKGKKGTARVRKGKQNITEKRSVRTKKGKATTEVEWRQPETPTKNKRSSSGCSRLETPKSYVEEDRVSCSSTDSYSGASACNTFSDGSCFEVEEPLSQSNCTIATDAPTAVYDFMHNNPDLHRQVLMYEPIWLEELQRKLLEKYNKKFKLTDLMDCLDSECITFRCESQRTNNRRK